MSEIFKGEIQTLIILALIAGSASATFVLILVLKPLLRRYALARPNARSSHQVPTPQGAGIAVICVTILTIALAAAALPNFDVSNLLLILVGSGILAVVGALDDVRSLAIAPRLAAQSGAVLIAIFAIPEHSQIFSAIPLYLERIVLFVALLWFVNLVNFMDGVDWMTVAEIVPISAALAVFGFLGALPANAALLALVLCGAMIGFAPLNRPVAKVFLGDVGSLPLGLLLGWLLVLLAENHFAAALLLPLYYIADSTVTLLRRIVAGENVTQAHRSHFYQLALSNGFTVYAIVGRVLLLNLALCALAGLTIVVGSRWLDIAAVAAACALVGLQLYRFQRPVA